MSRFVVVLMSMECRLHSLAGDALIVVVRQSPILEVQGGQKTAGASNFSALLLRPNKEIY